MRTYFEELEEKNLKPYAAKSAQSLGQQYNEPLSATRTCFQRDRDRVIHSKAFRRLKHKTQVFVANDNDHYRSRMTHTLEVAQISRHLSRLLQLNEDLSEVIALSHDLGHTPFGHSGERELNTLMKEHGGFEHNKQSRRIVDFLEQKYPLFPGLNLSFEVTDGLIKHQTSWDHPLEKEPVVSLEAQLVNLADEIAYNNHDLDDGLSAKILNEEELVSQVHLWKEAHEQVTTKYTNLSTRQRRHLINSHLISRFISDVFYTTEKTIKDTEINTFNDVKAANKKLVTFSKDLEENNKQLRKYLHKNFYLHPDVYRMNKRGQSIIRALFNAFLKDSKLLPVHFQSLIGDKYSKERVICDYIAGMTDNFAQKEFTILFS